MPELPEVETVRLTLKPALGAIIQSVWTSGQPLRLNRPLPVAALRRALTGRTITALRRIGKYLIIDTDGPRSLLVHLGMTGRLRVHKAGDPREPHTHVVMTTGDGREIRYSDPRRFGQVEVVRRGAEREHPSLAVLGLDPLTEKLDGKYLLDRARRRSASLKAFLMDQSVVAGVGNIYASEALWRSKLSPNSRVDRLTGPRATALARGVRDSLRHALARGGTSLRDFVDAHGAEGSNADYLIVYDRAGEPCRRCRTPIQRSVIQGRATYFCPSCQIL
jgi:formamidopyrimidine-DNA glycosylase